MKLGYAQRAAAHYASLTDATEGAACGEAAVRAAIEGQSGVMVKIVRDFRNNPYKWTHRPAAAGRHRQRRASHPTRLVQRRWLPAQRKIRRIRPPADRRRSQSADRRRFAAVCRVGERARREEIASARVINLMSPELLAKAKSLGFSDRQIANLTGQNRGRNPRLAEATRPRAQLPAGGHLRRRVRGLHALLLFHL